MPAERFIARSKVMRALADQIKRFARTDSNVLIAGETGTGKNVVARELRHVVEVACQTAQHTVTLTDLPDEVLATPLPIEKAAAPQPTLDEMERRYVAATLRASEGNQTVAAARLGISRKALWEKRKRYGMD